MKSYLQYLAFLIIILAFCEVAAANSEDVPESRQEELTMELKRQHNQSWQQQLTQQFLQLETWFSRQDRSHMQAGMQGLPLSKLQPPQMVAMHDFLNTALRPLGALRTISLLKLQQVQKEMAIPGSNMPTRLMLNSAGGFQEFSLSGPGIRLELSAKEGEWQINTLSLEQWPRQIPPAPQPELSSMEIRYPYIHWHEASGEDVLGHTADLMNNTLQTLSAQALKQACLADMATETQCEPTDAQIRNNPALPIAELSAKGRYMLMELITELHNHLGGSTLDNSHLMLSWAGTLSPSPSVRHNLLLNIQDKSVRGNPALWQIAQTGPQPGGLFMNMPANGVFIGYSRAGHNALTRWKTTHQAISKLVEKVPVGMEVEVATPQLMSPVVQSEARLAGGDEETTNQSSSDTPTWLKSPAFLNGMAMSLGYLGKSVSITTPLKPVVDIKRDGRPHRNIKVTVSLMVEDSMEPWLKEFPLIFDDNEEDYRSIVQLPATMAGKELTLIFNIHEPGTRYEGIYEYTLTVKGNKPTTAF